jgi:hypothetical protein
MDQLPAPAAEVLIAAKSGVDERPPFVDPDQFASVACS